VGAVEILLVVGGLVASLLILAMSSARSYFEKGRCEGMEEAIREIARGITSHCQLEGGGLPVGVEKAISALNAVSLSKRRRSAKGWRDAYNAQLWVLGDAIGEACWLKGHGAGVRRKAPAQGKIRVDLSLNELLQLGWLAHLGFQHMMPNYRGFEIYRFGGEEDAQEGARAIGKIEAVIPARARPIADLSVTHKSRQKLICDWWQPTPGRLSA
jgi:hypothetical protein